MLAPKTIRCAIYTRKSTEEGLEQDYNSLHAQRDACAAYVMSQAGEGWVLLPEIYDDGGFSGGNLERPALRRLMTEIEAKRVDVVVVYKVDRLTRSLPDFSRIVDVLDRTGKDYKNHCTAFKSKMSLRGLDSYGTVATEFLRAVYAVCAALGVECSFNLMYTELRNNRRIDGVPFALVEGLDLTLELHANGNTTLRVGKDLVSVLNDMLGAL